jgi:hypothetical protein
MTDYESHQILAASLALYFANEAFKHFEMKANGTIYTDNSVREKEKQTYIDLMIRCCNILCVELEVGMNEPHIFCKKIAEQLLNRFDYVRQIMED